MPRLKQGAAPIGGVPAEVARIVRPAVASAGLIARPAVKRDTLVSHTQFLPPNCGTRVAFFRGRPTDWTDAYAPGGYPYGRLPAPMTGVVTDLVAVSTGPPMPADARISLYTDDTRVAEFVWHAFPLVASASSGEHQTRSYKFGRKVLLPSRSRFWAEVEFPELPATARTLTVALWAETARILD